MEAGQTLLNAYRAYDFIASQNLVNKYELECLDLSYFVKNCDSKGYLKTKLLFFHLDFNPPNSFCGNFYAHYLQGNIKDKGVRVFHLDIRSLQNKVTEVKST